MSRVANSPVELPKGVEIKMEGDQLSIKGGKGNLSLPLNSDVKINQEDNVLSFEAVNSSKAARALSGTYRALVNNMVVGVTAGFEKKLQLNGVGYRAKAAGKTVNLTLGFSHPVDYALPEGVTAETPSNTEIVLKSWLGKAKMYHTKKATNTKRTIFFILTFNLK